VTIKKNHNKKSFIRKPHLEGGKEYLKEFLKENLKYPKEALKTGIQGDVLISFSVNQFGEVSNPQIIKGIGYGCDEEAIRLVKLLKYQEVKNRGLRVTTRNRLKIPFRLKLIKRTLNISYTSTHEKSNDSLFPKGTKDKDKEKGETYSYTIYI
jgi:protein TonB